MTVALIIPELEYGGEKTGFFFLISVKFSYILNLHTIMCVETTHKSSKGKLKKREIDENEIRLRNILDSLS